MALAKPTTTTQTAAQETPEEQLTEQGVQATAEEQQVHTAPAEEQPQQAVAPAAQPEQAVAKRSGSQVATAKQQFEGNMAEAGYEGLNLGGMSFEQIRLPGEGQFLLGQEDVELGKEFDCVIQSTQARYVVRQSNEEDADMFYSYDPKGLTDSDGNDMSEKLQEWKEDGYDKPVIKKYIEARAILINAGDNDGMMVMLSISPSSVQKFSGFIAQQQFRRKKLPHEYVTKCQVGPKVKRDGGSSFFPWKFVEGGPLPEGLF